jgi:hypothetical protein
MQRIGWSLLFWLSATACKNERQQIAEKVADQEAIVRQAQENLKREAALREAKLKREITNNPGAFLEAAQFETFNKGILSSYRQLTKMTVTNKTKYPLTSLSGEVHWYSDAGDVREKTMFRVKGSLAGGDSKVFSTGDGSLESGTTESHAKKLRVVFDSAKIVETVE